MSEAKESFKLKCATIVEASELAELVNSYVKDILPTAVLGRFGTSVINSLILRGAVGFPFCH